MSRLIMANLKGPGVDITADSALQPGAGQQLRIVGDIPCRPWFAEFSCSGDTAIETRNTRRPDELNCVEIPAALLQRGRPIDAYIVIGSRAARTPYCKVMLDVPRRGDQ